MLCASAAGPDVVSHLGHVTDGTQIAVAVQIYPDALLVDRQRANTLVAFEARLENSQIRAVHVERVLAVFGLAERRGQADHDVVRRTVRRPKRARQGLVVERHPVATVLRESEPVERRGAQLQVV